MQKILTYLLLAACIYTIGFLSAHAYQAAMTDPIKIYYDVPEQVPTVHLQGIRNGEVFGTVTPGAVAMTTPAPAAAPVPTTGNA